MYYVYITGGNTGIGKATAYELARRNAKIIIACRNDIKGEAVARNIKIKTGNPFVSCSRLDLSNQRSIREFVQDFTLKEHGLHVLINNAGNEFIANIHQVKFNLGWSSFVVLLKCECP